MRGLRFWFIIIVLILLIALIASVRAMQPIQSQNPDFATVTPTFTASPTALVLASATPVPTQDLTPNPNNCTYPAGIWAANPFAWELEAIRVGPYQIDKQQAVNMLNSTSTDTYPRLLKEILTVVLNQRHGADASPILLPLSDAVRWLDAHPNSQDVSTADEETARAYLEMLAGFNNGGSGPGLCTSALTAVARTPTPSPTSPPEVTAVPTSTVIASPTATVTLRPPLVLFPTRTAAPTRTQAVQPTATRTPTNTLPPPPPTATPTTSLPPTPTTAPTAVNP